ncbi:MAG: hypothetical protein AAGB31_15855 [Bdellovibrio sp.]
MVGYRENSWVYAVDADELESLLQKAERVYGRVEISESTLAWSPTRYNSDTHAALLLNVHEIKREPFRIEQTFSHKYVGGEIQKPRELDGKRFKVIFEEIREGE